MVKLNSSNSRAGVLLLPLNYNKITARAEPSPYLKNVVFYINKKSSNILDWLLYFAGIIIFSISITMFTAPNNIAPGGLTGVSTVIKHITDIPIGTMYLILNIPVFILGYVFFKFRFIAKTIVLTLLLSFSIDLIAMFIAPYTENKLLACVYGGILSGIGLAIIHVRGASTGGTDIIARVINKRLSFLSMGKIILSLDALVVISAAVFFRSLESGLYAMITMYVSSKMIDSIIYGADKGKVVLVNSGKNDLIVEDIFKIMGRGVTVLNSTSAYTGAEKKVIMCAVRRHETVAIHKIIRNNDPEAFVITFEAGEITGEGFRQITNYN